MSYTLTTLKTAVQDYAENSETTFVSGGGGGASAGPVTVEY